MPSTALRVDPRWTPARLRSGASTFQHLARTGARTALVRGIARRLCPRGRSPGLREAIGTAWRWLPTYYVADSRGDHWQSATQTLRSGYGDCEDWSVVLAAVLIALRVDARLVTVPGHVGVAIPWLHGFDPWGWPVWRHGRTHLLLLESTWSPYERRSLVPGGGAERLGRWVGTPFLQHGGPLSARDRSTRPRVPRRIRGR